MGMGGGGEKRAGACLFAFLATSAHHRFWNGLRVKKGGIGQECRQKTAPGRFGITSELI